LSIRKTYFYNNDEKTDMILIYGECGKNATDAADLYAERFPDRIYPVPKTFRKLETKLRENWPSLKRVRQRTATGPQNEALVLEALEENPHIRQNQLGR
jgi:hypothetical protein